MRDILEDRIELFRLNLVPEHILHRLLYWILFLLDMPGGLSLGLDLPDSLSNRLRHLSLQWITSFVIAPMHTDRSRNEMSEVVREIRSFLLYCLALVFLWCTSKRVGCA